MTFIRKHRRTMVLCLIDAAICVLSCATSYMLLYVAASDFGVSIKLNLDTLIWHAVTISSCFLFGMWFCRVYKSIWRFATAIDVMKCFFGILLGLIVYYPFKLVFYSDFSDVCIAIEYLLVTISIISSRCIYKYLYLRLSNTPSQHRSRTMIIGAGVAGKKVIDEMHSGAAYRPVVLVDDDPKKSGRTIASVLVAGTTYDIPKLVEKYRVKTIFFAIPSINPDERRRILNICSETVCEVKVVPYMYELIQNADFLTQGKNINIEDLLGREPIGFSDFEVQHLICGRVCMVTGGGGSIGSELCRQIAAHNPKKLIIIDIYENNAYDIQQELLLDYPDIDLDVRIASVRDFDKMKCLFEMFMPELVFHAAAHKHVPLMETSPEEAIKNNIGGTYNVAYLANEYKAQKFVLVSTDKAVNPTNVMGATKRCCEMIVEYFSQVTDFTDFVAVRFGNVLGSNGSVIPLFEKQLAQGGPLTVTHPDIIRYFMTIPEAVFLILQAATLAKGGEIFVLDMGEPVKILNLAENLIKLHGKEPYKDIDITFTGLRPGEKLFEELLMSEEGIKETQNKKIFIGKQIKIDEKDFPQMIENIKKIAYSNNSGEAVEALRRLVPTFNHIVINK
ncbi:MAG: polysaccharide biosynthesis protein [Firmicutes bacterium]|nr:polysaccharide biosynthesis protein [Bacillota bacterium]